MSLPVDVKMALDRMAEGQSTKALAQNYQTLSDRYRRDSEDTVLQIRSHEEALAYALARMPATYGAVHDVLGRAIETIPELGPKSVLDLGCGPGTATLAAMEHFLHLDDIRMVEPNTHLAGLAKHLCANVSGKILHETQTLSKADLVTQADLVLLSYVLNEIPEAELEATVDRLWSATKQALIIVEPGTPAGYALILKIREKLLALGARIAAPCPHDMECPLKNTSLWCHMSTRIERSAIHKRVKSGAALSYEDEKFSYIVATRLLAARPNARLIGHPHGQKLISLQLCDRDGSARTRTLSRRDEEYKRAKKLEWGDGL